MDVLVQSTELFRDGVRLVELPPPTRALALGDELRFRTCAHQLLDDLEDGLRFVAARGDREEVLDGGIGSLDLELEPEGGITLEHLVPRDGFFRDAFREFDLIFPADLQQERKGDRRDTRSRS